VNDDTFDALVLQANEITRDSESNLDWLDIDAYTNISYTLMVSKLANDSILSGWRHAFRHEVKIYFDRLGIATTEWPDKTWIVDSGSSVTLAHTYTGISDTSPDSGNFNQLTARGQTWTLAHYDGPIEDHWEASSASFLLLGPNIYLSESIASSFRTVTYASPGSGHWLVRTTPSVVPEPSTFSMLAFGCIAMAGYNRLRRRRK